MSLIKAIMISVLILMSSFLPKLYVQYKKEQRREEMLLKKEFKETIESLEISQA